MEEVVVGALVRGGRVLLVHRSPDRRDHPGVWDLPGGHVEAGESEPVALARELHEELGVRVDPAAAYLLSRWEAAGGGGERVALSAWLVERWQEEPANLAPEEHDDLGWFDPEQLPPLAHDHLSAVLVSVLGEGRLGTAQNGARSKRPQARKAKSPR